MTGASRPLRPDPRRKARFREIARGIVAKDRYNRKYGIAVDTAGAIAQALERAYRDGVCNDRAAALPAPEQGDTRLLEWALAHHGREMPSGASACTLWDAMPTSHAMAISLRLLPNAERRDG